MGAQFIIGCGMQLIDSIIEIREQKIRYLIYRLSSVLQTFNRGMISKHVLQCITIMLVKNIHKIILYTSAFLSLY